MNSHKIVGLIQTRGVSGRGVSGRGGPRAVCGLGRESLQARKDGRESQHLVPVWPHPG